MADNVDSAQFYLVQLFCGLKSTWRSMRVTPTLFQPVGGRRWVFIQALRSLEKPRHHYPLQPKSLTCSLEFHAVHNEACIL
jgi:hypothetical protein